MKKYFSLAIFITIITATMLYIVPVLLSAKSTLCVILGMSLVIFGVIPYSVFFLRNYSRYLKSTAKFMVIFIAMLLFQSCSLNKVPAGHVGIKAYLLGGAKGVDSEEIGPGYYLCGPNTEIYTFPTFTQNYVWTKDATEGSENDESITFQTISGMDVNADIGISYHIQPEKVRMIFQRYRRGIEEITDVFLRNMTRDAFVKKGSLRTPEDVYGSGKTELINDVMQYVSAQTTEIGIVIEGIYLVGTFRMPEKIVTALNMKIEATQRAEQRENELRETEAQAKKQIAEARGQADSLLAIAEAQSKANTLIAKSLTPELVQYKMIERWDGIMPKVSGGNGMIPMIDIK